MVTIAEFSIWRSQLARVISAEFPTAVKGLVEPPARVTGAAM